MSAARRFSSSCVHCISAVYRGACEGSTQGAVPACCQGILGRILRLGCASWGGVFGWPAAGSKGEGGWLYGMSEVSGFWWCVHCEVLGVGDRTQARTVRLWFSAGPCSCRHKQQLPPWARASRSVCCRVVRGVLFDNGIQEQQGTCASRAAATATSCALVLGSVALSCVAPLRFRAQQQLV